MSITARLRSAGRSLLALGHGQALAARRAPQDAPPPRPAAMFREVAADDMVALLERLPDPDEVLQRNGFARVDLAKMLYDDEVSGAFETRADALVSTPWRLEGEGIQQAQIDALWAELEPHMEGAVRTFAKAVPFGYSVAEAVYRPGGLAFVAEKPLEWFAPQRDGSLLYLPASGTPVQVDTRYKFLLTRRNATWRQPYGEALLSRLYWAWLFRHNGWQFWVQFLERFGQPIILGQVNAADAFVAALSAAGLESVVAVAPDEKVSAVTASGAETFAKFDEVLSRRVQKLVLGQTLTTDVSGSGGSYAAAKIHDSVRMDKRNADIRLVTRPAQALVDGTWWAMGFQAPAPRIVFADDTGLEADRADRDAKLVQAGVLKLTEQYLLRTYDYEDGDFEIPEVPAPLAQAQGQDPGNPPPADPQGGQGNPADPAPADPQGPGDGPAGETLAARGGVDLAARGGVDLAVPEFDPQGDLPQPVPATAILAAIRKAKGRADLEHRLGLLVQKHKGQELAVLMERALFLADIYGYSSTLGEAGDGE